MRGVLRRQPRRTTRRVLSVDIGRIRRVITRVVVRVVCVENVDQLVEVIRSRNFIKHARCLALVAECAVRKQPALSVRTPRKIRDVDFVENAVNH